MRGGHASAVTPPAGCAQVDLFEDANEPLVCPVRNPATRGANGRGKPDVGRHPIQGALKNLGHQVGRSMVARILKAQGLPPVPMHPTLWQTFLRAHWARSRRLISSPLRSRRGRDS